ncbi:hypothetical protein ACR9YC_09765 [Parasphingorhabdus sp. DH2-15]|uniref:hypothetical protein n=1 Tax=Parasphingorhabdus sp. DH2-15 TaxID=3444112 RepID=UPI003F6862E9
MVLLNRLAGIGLIILGVITALYPEIFTLFYRVGLDDPTARTVIAAIIGGGEIGIGIALLISFERSAENHIVEARTKIRINALMIGGIVAVRLFWTLAYANYNFVVIIEIIVELLLLITLTWAWRRWAL